MAFQQTRASSRLPQECWDEIVSMLDTADLNSCALTASRLLHPAQAVLFHDITVVHPKDAVGLASGETFLTQEQNLAYIIGAYTRLHSVLVSSPHLKSRIRVISLAAHVESVAIVADMDLPRISDMTLVGPDERPALDGPLVPSLTRLIGLPSLRRLNLRSDFDPSIFADCSSSLEELVLDGVRPRKPWNEWAPSTTRERPALKRLHLQLVREEEGVYDEEEEEDDEEEEEDDEDEDDSDSDDEEDESGRSALAWLLHPNSPFVLTGVEELTIFGPMTGDAHLLLQSAAPSIQRLDIGPNEIIEHLNLAPLSDLNFLRFYITKLNDIALLFGPLLRLVRNTHTNKIRIICFEVLEFSVADMNAELEAELCSFHEQFKQLHREGALPSLQLVGLPLLPEPLGRDPAPGSSVWTGESWRREDGGGLCFVLLLQCLEGNRRTYPFRMDFILSSP
ncbi:hypothetical protein FB45DRAFT_861243 [Roridomyces roridus]|uniref:F-box domain-containing protein n=1 Tax=Roridomyces roridus TaxID=1738132 RepID=A0AAD7CA30_9AGAR|nr:hypothetical protein FB45DRAFT_861243 [Roridomyces roridus]